MSLPLTSIPDINGLRDPAANASRSSWICPRAKSIGKKASAALATVVVLCEAVMLAGCAGVTLI